MLIQEIRIFFIDFSKIKKKKKIPIKVYLKKKNYRKIIKTSKAHMQKVRIQIIAAKIPIKIIEFSRDYKPSAE